LSRFGEGTGREANVWAWDKETGKVEQRSVNAVAYQNNLYRPPQAALDQLGLAASAQAGEGIDPYLWERLFADADRVLGNMLMAVTSRVTLPPAGSQGMADLLRMVILLDSRTPAKMDMVRQLEEFMTNLMAKVAAHNDPSLFGEEGAPDVEVPLKTGTSSCHAP
jgi:hypothetical protein